MTHPHWWHSHESFHPWSLFYSIMSHLQFPMLLTRPRILWKRAIWLPQQRHDSRLGPCRHHPSVVDSEQKHRHSVHTDRQLSRALRRSTCARVVGEIGAAFSDGLELRCNFYSRILVITSRISLLLRAFLKAGMNNSAVSSWPVCFRGSGVVWLKTWPAEVPPPLTGDSFKTAHVGFYPEAT